jgi:Tol biopolymer transport system component
MACLILLSSQATGASAGKPDAAPAAAQPAGKVVFGRAIRNPDGTGHSSSLFRVNADGSAPTRLTPTSERIFDGNQTWAPGGLRIAFSRYDAERHKSDIHLMRQQGGPSRQITVGDGSYDYPVWRGNTIAFVSSYEHRGDCLSLIHPDGLGQQDLFCPPGGQGGQTASVSEPVWSADGRSLLIQSGYFEGQLEYEWHSFVYKVDVRTGAASLLTDQVLDDFLPLAFAPDGSQGVYHARSSNSSADLLKVDFATDELTNLGDGYAAVYSKDGGRIAFSRSVLTGPPYESFDYLFVMDADGSKVRRVTTERVDYLEYATQEWSEDGNKVLVNRSVYGPSGGLPRTCMCIVDVNTRAVTQLPTGYAGQDSWYQRSIPRQ